MIFFIHLRPNMEKYEKNNDNSKLLIISCKKILSEFMILVIWNFVYWKFELLFL